ncbi:hypothetical protein [Streptomyces lateritius]|uniref:hypothetical protein n=1 Tax=Streptomyces lateritius TaxID=67313 RepID=UPI001C8CC48C|nr:hypothetical protein [Streptomyces lateritius]MBX9424867.1 hypothetical protein [Streptomyces lateritius]
MADLLDDPPGLSAAPAAAGELDPPEEPPPLDETARAVRALRQTEFLARTKRLRSAAA